MEKLVTIAIVIGLFGATVLLSGLWLLHTAVNTGNPWQGVVAAALAVSGLAATIAFFKALG